MTKLSDMQLVLLSTAAARDGGSLYPPADSLGPRGDRIRRSVAALIKKGLAYEVEVTSAAALWREDGDLLFGVAITDAGRAAVAAGDQLPEVETPELAPGAAAAATDSKTTPPRRDSKINAVTDLLKRQSGATLAEMVEATGWLPHTTRAALTGLRKKGHDIAKTKRDEVTCYRIGGAA